MRSFLPSISISFRMTLYAACLEGSDPVRLLDKRLNARKGFSSPNSFFFFYSKFVIWIFPFQKLGMNLIGLAWWNMITWPLEGLPLPLKLLKKPISFWKFIKRSLTSVIKCRGRGSWFFIPSVSNMKIFVSRLSDYHMFSLFYLTSFCQASLHLW